MSFNATGYTPEEEAAILWGDMTPDQRMDALANLDEENAERWELLQGFYEELLAAREGRGRAWPYSPQLSSSEDAKVTLNVLSSFIDKRMDRTGWITRKAEEIETGRVGW